METKTETITSRVARIAVVICISMMAYFFIMNIAGMAAHIELRALNFFILAGGVYYALKGYKSNRQPADAYFEGLALGCMTTLFAVGMFSVFVMLYLMLDPSLFAQIIMHAPVIVSGISPVTAAIVVFVEGTSSGFVLSFVLMQYFKKSIGEPAGSAGE